MKRTLTIGGSFALSALIIGFAVLVRDPAPTTNIGGVEQVSGGYTNTLRTYRETLDTDNDGRSDWQEILQKTDPYTPDSAPTSTQKTYDSIEDYFINIDPGDRSGSTTEPDTLTSTFARTYMEQLIRYGQDGTTEEEIDALTNTALQFAEKEARYTRYSEVNLNINQDSTAADVRLYGNELGALLSTPLVPEEVDPFSIMYVAQQRNDPRVLELLYIYSEAYRYLGDQMLALRVPHTLVQEHMSLLNTIMKLSESYERIITPFFTDPLLAYTHLNATLEGLGEYSASMDRVKNILVTNDVYYTSEEPGAYFYANN